MTTVILAGGLVAVGALAVLMLDPRWRLPALVIAVLAVPGNVDNVLPQMVLDPNPLPNNTAPAVSVIDLLIAWAVVLTVRDGRRGRRLDLFLGVGVALAVCAAVSALVAVAGGVDPWAGVRGMLLIARLPALLYLSRALLSGRQDLSRIAIACAVGGIVLIGNAVYTTSVTGDPRLTASTFGRNSLAVALVLIAIVSGALMLDRIGRPGEGRRWWSLTLGAGFVAGLAIFAAVATGTRMSLFVLIAAGMVGLVANRGWRKRAGVERVAAVAAAVVLIVSTSAVLSAEGGRTLSLFTDPGTTVTAVTDPGSLPSYSEVRSRGEFWDIAIKLAEAHPLFGVGPFQWNFERYAMTTYEPVVADAHNAYLQMAAEFGIPTLGIYLLLIALVVGRIFVQLRDERSGLATSWLVVAFAAAGLAYLGTDLTNSHLFNVRVGGFGWLLIASSLAIARTEAVVARGETARSTGRRHHLDAGAHS
jgi:O-antigen ligase